MRQAASPAPCITAMTCSAHLGVYEVEEGWQGVCEAEAALES